MKTKILLSFILVFTQLGYAQTSENKLDHEGRSLRDMTYHNYKQVKSIPDFVNYFSERRPAQERQEIIEHLELLKQLPRIKVTEDGFLLSEGEAYLNIDIRGYKKNRFVMNGHIVLFDPHVSLVKQADALLQKINKARQGEHSLFSLLAPDANAIGPILTVAISGLTFIGINIVQKLSDHYAEGAMNAWDWEWCSKHDHPSSDNDNPYKCKDYRKNKADLLKNKPENQAIKNALSDDPKKKTDLFVAYEDKKKCPYETNGKYFSALVKRIQKAEKTEEDLRIYAELNGDKFKQVRVFQDSYDDGPIKSNLIATYLPDGDGALKEIVLPNPEKDTPASLKAAAKAKKTTSPLKKDENAGVPNQIKIAATADLKDDPQTQALQEFHQALQKYVADLLTACNLEKQKKEAERISPETRPKQEKAAK
jgi:hypothetical protein